MTRLLLVAAVVLGAPTVLVLLAERGGPVGFVGPWLLLAYLLYRAAPGVRADVEKVHLPKFGRRFGRVRGERL